MVNDKLAVKLGINHQESKCCMRSPQMDGKTLFDMTTLNHDGMQMLVFADTNTRIMDGTSHRKCLAA